MSGAPYKADKIPELTPAMIEAGVTFLADQGVVEFSTNIATPETVIEFYRVMEAARAPNARSPGDGKTHSSNRSRRRSVGEDRR